MTSEYKTEQPERSEIDALQGPAVVEFGTNWCGVQTRFGSCSSGSAGSTSGSVS